MVLGSTCFNMIRFHSTGHKEYCKNVKNIWSYQSKGEEFSTVLIYGTFPTTALPSLSTQIDSICICISSFFGKRTRHKQDNFWFCLLSNLGMKVMVLFCFALQRWDPSKTNIYVVTIFVPGKEIRLFQEVDTFVSLWISKRVRLLLQKEWEQYFQYL